MSVDVMLVVLLAALLHAGWNALIKSGKDKFIDTVRLVIGSGVVAGALIPVLPSPAPESWPYLAASAAIHAVYFCLIALSYRTGDLSFAYPIMRGTAPLVTALLAAVLIDEELGAGWVGVLLLCGGILWLAHGGRIPGDPRHALRFPLLAAVGIVCYTIVDGLGARAAGNPFSYLVWMSFLTMFPVVVLALILRPDALRATTRRDGFQGLAAGIVSAGAYGLVLWAMTQAPIALVAALRETSVLFGTALGAWLLRERFGGERWLAAALITAGAVAIKAL